MKNIKKLICILLAALTVLSCAAFSACSGGSDEETNKAVPDVTLKNGEKVSSADNSDKPAITDGNISSQSSKNAPQFILSTLTSEYAAGETVTVSVWLENSPLTAALDFYIVADGAEYVEYAPCSVGDMQIMADGSEDTFRMMGIVARTIDIDMEKLVEVTFKIPVAAKPGDKIEFKGIVEEIAKGLDESGDKTQSVKDKSTAPTLTVTVK